MKDSGCYCVEPVYNPEAIRDYCFLDNCSFKKEVLQDLIKKARQHLAAVGWTFRYSFDKYRNSNKVKYVPPNGGKQQITLRNACKFYLQCEDGGVEDIKSADKCTKKRKADGKNVGEIEVKDSKRKDEDTSLCLDNRQLDFDDFEMEEVQHKMRALRLENGEFGFDDSRKSVNGRENRDGVIEVHDISEEEEEVPKINFRKVKKRKVRFIEDIGKTKLNALKNRKRRITASDLYGERMLRCMQGI